MENSTVRSVQKLFTWEIQVSIVVIIQDNSNLALRI